MNVAVGIRIRPLIASELQSPCPSPTSGNKLAWTARGPPEAEDTIEELRDMRGLIKGGQTWTFDRVFPPSANTQRVYDGICAPIVQAAMRGYNGTIFAYGQTSSGKTHTLMGDAKEPGIIVLAVHDVFEHIAFAGAPPDGGARFSEFLVRVSYFEIYNEVIEDLFEDPGTKSPHGRMRLGSGASVSSGRQRVRITESSDGRGPIVVGAVEHEVTTPEQVLERLAQGELSRHYGATGMNQRSSRSHTIFRMALARYLPPRVGQPPSPAVWKSTLNLVDLAGSERLAKTQATGQRAREGQAINLSLLTLGRVLKHLAKVAKMEEARRAGDAAIGAVGSGSAEHERELMRARVQAPFRDSQLTRLLQTSLGGNARTGESRGPPHHPLPPPLTDAPPPPLLSHALHDFARAAKPRRVEDDAALLGSR